jgi:hypothetical protein
MTISVTTMVRQPTSLTLAVAVLVCATGCLRTGPPLAHGAPSNLAIYNATGKTVVLQLRVADVVQNITMDAATNDHEVWYGLEFHPSGGAFHVSVVADYGPGWSSDFPAWQNASIRIVAYPTNISVMEYHGIPGTM